MFCSPYMVQSDITTKNHSDCPYILGCQRGKSILQTCHAACGQRWSRAMPIAGRERWRWRKRSFQNVWEATIVSADMSGYMNGLVYVMPRTHSYTFPLGRTSKEVYVLSQTRDDERFRDDDDRKSPCARGCKHHHGCVAAETLEKSSDREGDRWGRSAEGMADLAGQHTARDQE